MKELLATYEALLKRAADMLFYQAQGTATPALMKHASKWLDDYRQLTNQQERAVKQLSLWEGHRQPQRTLIKNETGMVLDVSVQEENFADLPTSTFILREHKHGD